MNIGKAIQAQRIDNGRMSDSRHWTQGRCALRAGISQSQWADAEANRKDPGLQMLVKLAAGLEMPLWRLIREAEKRT